MKATSRRQALATATSLALTGALATWARAETIIVTGPMSDAIAAARS